MSLSKKSGLGRSVRSLLGASALCSLFLVSGANAQTPAPGAAVINSVARVAYDANELEVRLYLFHEVARTVLGWSESDAAMNRSRYLDATWLSQVPGWSLPLWSEMTRLEPNHDILYDLGRALTQREAPGQRYDLMVKAIQRQIDTVRIRSSVLQRMHSVVANHRVISPLFWSQTLSTRNQLSQRLRTSLRPVRLTAGMTNAQKIESLGRLVWINSQRTLLDFDNVEGFNLGFKTVPQLKS